MAVLAFLGPTQLRNYMDWNAADYPPFSDEAGRIAYWSGDDGIVATGSGGFFLQGYAGSDGLMGADGDDTIYGHNGKGRAVVADGNDSLWGGGGDDLLYGQEGNDYLDPGTGDDTLYGGNGVDKVAYIGLSESITVNLLAEEAYSGSKNDDLHEIEDVGGTNRGDTIIGSDGSNVIKGHGGDDSLDGGAGTDTAQFTGDRANYAVSLVSGDVIRIEDRRTLEQRQDDDPRTIYSVAEGTDRLVNFETFQFKDGTVDQETLFEGNNELDGSDFADSLFGYAGDDTLTGNDGNDVLEGGSGDDFLDGGAGSDTISGGAGFDAVTYYSYSASINANFSTGVVWIPDAGGEVDQLDSVEEILTGDGDDTVIGNDGANFVYAQGGDNELHGGEGNDTLSAAFGGGDNSLYGDGGDDTLTVLGFVGGTNLLDGGAGNDSMTGSTGDDTYVVDSMLDIVEEEDDSGVDTVRSGIGYRLGANIERLILTGSAQVNGLGNSLDNTLIGNDGDNYIDGFAGADSMEGGLGSDLYVIRDVTDTIIEKGFDYDRVRSRIDYTLTDLVEELTLVGSAVRGVGNDLGNKIVGNSEKNVLTGLAGNDQLFGGAGNDVLLGGVGADLLNGGAGIDRAQYSQATAGLRADLQAPGTNTREAAGDTYVSIENLFGTRFNDVLLGDSGPNALYGHLGNDVLYGRAGNDALYGGANPDRFVFAAGGDRDTVYDFQNDLDMIDLRTFGFASPGAALNVAAQKDGNVVFDFGDGDLLIVANTSEAQILDDILV